MKAGHTHYLAKAVFATLSAWCMEQDIQQVAFDNSRPFSLSGRQCDVIEVFSGIGMLTLRCGHHGLQAGEPIDLLTGWDLRDAGDRRELMAYIRRARPKLVMAALPCTYWCAWTHINFAGREMELAELREGERVFLELALDIFREQRNRGDHAVLENPATSDLFGHELIQELASWPGVIPVKLDMCQFNKREIHEPHDLLRKSTKLLVTHPIFAEALGQVCGRDHVHAVVQGTDSRPSGAYTAEFCDAMLQALNRIYATADFGSQACLSDQDAFDVTPALLEIQDREVHAQSGGDVCLEPEAWRPAVRHAERMLASRTGASIYCEEKSPLGQLIRPLVPWQSIRTIQVARQPKAKRWNPASPDTHRVSVLLQAKGATTGEDGVIEVTAERLLHAVAVRERFSRPMQLGIFIFGYGNLTEPTAPTPEDAVPSRISDEIWFIDGTPPDRELRATIARIHNNLGHPEAPTLRRMLLQANATDKALAIASGLRCAVCLRKRSLPLARPSAVPRVGSFNEKVGMDMFFLHDARHHKWMYLSILEMSGLLQVCHQIATRDPAAIWDLFAKLWLSWAGPS